MTGPKKHFIILGAGISGLTLGWYLKKRFGDEALITIIEKSDRVGGWIRSYQKDGRVYEAGPRSLRSGKPGVVMLRFVKQLGMENQIISCDQDSRYKFIYFGKKLWEFPASFYDFILSPLMRNAVNALWDEKFGGKGGGKVEGFFRQTLGDKFTDFLLTGKLIRRVMALAKHEQRQTPTEAKDESIASFFYRKLGHFLTYTIVDAWVMGIFAGDITKLSIKSCLPYIYKAEKEHGSLIKAFGKKDNPEQDVEETDKEEDPFVSSMQGKGVFSFNKGLEELPQTIAKKIDAKILLGVDVKSLRVDAQSVEVIMGDGQVMKGDRLFAAIPASALAHLIRPWIAEAAQLLEKIPYSSLAVVTVVYKKKVLSNRGFGYLVPHNEHENILGCVWNSVVFPQHFPDGSTSLSVMIGGAHMLEFPSLTKEEFIEIALESISRHLEIRDRPDSIEVSICNNAIPQYIVGHSKRLARINALMREFTPTITLLGSSYYGVGISDCISHAKRMAKKFDSQDH